MFLEVRDALEGLGTAFLCPFKVTQTYAFEGLKACLGWKRHVGGGFCVSTIFKQLGGLETPP